MNKYAKMINTMCFFFLVVNASAEHREHEKVSIKSVTSLLLGRGRMTTGRRTAPIPQLNCLSNCQDAPDTVYCRNAGFDGTDVVWECKSDPPGKQFSYLNVQCEGYDYPDDPFILKGSCSIDFKMSGQSTRRPIHTSVDPEPNPSGAIIFMCILAITWLYCITSSGDNNHTSYRYSYSSPRYRSSTSDFWSGAGAGYVAGRSGLGSSWGSSGQSSWGGGRSFGGSSFASTSRR